MRFQVVMRKSEESYSVSCPALKGCWSQGNTEEQALENIKDAIKEYLEAVRDIKKKGKVVEIDVEVAA